MYPMNTVIDPEEPIIYLHMYPLSEDHSIDSWLTTFLVHQFKEYRFLKVSNISEADIVFVELQDWLRKEMLQDLAEGRRVRVAGGHSTQVTVAWSGENHNLEYFKDLYYIYNFVIKLFISH